MMTDCHLRIEKVLVVSSVVHADTMSMSAITYPVAANPSQIQTAPTTSGLRRRLAMWRPRRWDDRPYIERYASLGELALRSVPEIPSIYR